MRIAYLCQSYPPMISGAAIVVKQLAEGVAACGHKVLVISASDNSQSGNVTNGNLSHKKLRSYPNPLRVEQNFVLWERKEIIVSLKAFNPDLLHIHDATLTGVAGLKASQELDIPTVFTVHALPWLVTDYFPDIPGLQPAIEKGLYR